MRQRSTDLMSLYELYDEIISFKLITSGSALNQIESKKKSMKVKVERSLFTQCSRCRKSSRRHSPASLMSRCTRGVGSCRCIDCARVRIDCAQGPHQTTIRPLCFNFGNQKRMRASTHLRCACVCVCVSAAIKVACHLIFSLRWGKGREGEDEDTADRHPIC